MLDQETVRSFIKVAELQSFTKAAEKLNKTPATISYRIKMLEEHVDTLLFYRTTRAVTLTPAGQHLLTKCNQWLNWLDTMPNELKQINDGTERHFKIVVNNLLYNNQAVANLLTHLNTLFPLTHFQFSQQVYMGVWDKLLHNEYHLAIGVTGWETMDYHIQYLPLGKINWVFAISPNHPLIAITPKPLEDFQLRIYPAINIEDTAIHLNKRVAWLLPGQTEILVPDLATKIECHLQGTGIGFLPKKVCQPYLDSGQLVACQIIYPRFPSPLSLAWRSSSVGNICQYIVSLFQKRHILTHDFYHNLDHQPNLY